MSTVQRRPLVPNVAGHSKQAAAHRLGNGREAPSATPRRPQEVAYWAGCCAILLGGLSLSSESLAHGGETNTGDQPVTAPLPSGHPVKNVGSKVRVRGAYGTRITAELVNQVYAGNGAQQRYLLVDVTARVPTPELGIGNKTEAQNARLTLQYTSPGATVPYAECTLEPRQISARTVTYSLGLKANALLTMLRWGHCDDPNRPGFDSVFPQSNVGDIAQLVGADGQVIAELQVPPAMTVDLPAKARKQPRPSIAKLMESGAYRVKRQRS